MALLVTCRTLKQGRPALPCDDSHVLVDPPALGSEAPRGPGAAGPLGCSSYRRGLGPPAPWEVRVVRDSRVFARRLLSAEGAFYRCR